MLVSGGFTFFTDRVRQRLDLDYSHANVLEVVDGRLTGKVVGGIVDRVGSIRPAFIFLAVLVVLPAPLLWALNVEKGREDAQGLAEREEVGKGTYERVSDDGE